MYKLYARPGTGSAAVEALLAVAGFAHDIVDVPKDAAKKAPDWYMAINARGEVPALQLPDGSLMTESAAMMIYLADLAKYLAPDVTSPARSAYLRWMVYLAAAPYTTDLRMYYPDRYSTDAAHAPAIKAQAIADLDRDFEYLANGLKLADSGPFILGASFSAVDIYAAMLLTWALDFPKLMASQPRLAELYRAVTANPVIRKVFDRNGMP